MFDAIFGRSVKILKILAKVQCVLAFVLASMLCGAVHEMLKPINQFSAIVLGLVVAVVFWVLQMFLAWAVYAFAELVEHTEATHKELSDMSEGLARYTQATYEELQHEQRAGSIHQRHGQDHEQHEQEPLPCGKALLRRGGTRPRRSPPAVREQQQINKEGY